jgi:CheY-like chemotaxis protein
MSKHALVVDDSKSARVSLGRLLEDYRFSVDTAESAPEALDHLCSNRPDIIFMDHTMPGMDGLQAVKVIKANPSTATIPIMMYTSKEGDLYLSQARALGALGILPKDVKPTALFEVLRELGLVEEPEQVVSPSMVESTPEHIHDNEFDAERFARDMARQTAVMVESALRTSAREIVQEQLVEFRSGALWTSEAVARHTAGEIHRELTNPESAMTPSGRERYGSPLGIAMVGMLVLMLTIPAFWFYNLYAQERDRHQALVAASAGLAEALEQQLLGAQEENEQLRVALQSVPESGSYADRELIDLAAWAFNHSGQYDYAEVALDDHRLLAVQELISVLERQGFEGQLQLRVHTGTFCLSDTEAQGFKLAEDELPIDNCDLLGQVTGPDSSVGHQQSIAFANFYSNSSALQGSGIGLDIAAIGTDEPLKEYPYPTTGITAGEWNTVARQNNRVELVIIPGRLAQR